MKTLKTIGLLLLTAGVAGGCAQTEERTLTGTIDQTTFSTAVTRITVKQGDVTIAEAQPGDDGSFTLTLLSGAGYQIDLISGDTTLPLVIPRIDSDTSSAGDFALDTSFGVPEEMVFIDLHALFETLETALGEEADPPKDFDLGTLRYMSDPFGTQYISSEDESVTCVDGVDTTTGARCIDPGPAGVPACLEDVTDTAYLEAEPLDSSAVEGVLADRSIPLALCCGGGRHGDEGGEGGHPDEGDRH